MQFAEVDLNRADLFASVSIGGGWDLVHAFICVVFRISEKYCTSGL